MEAAYHDFPKAVTADTSLRVDSLWIAGDHCPEWTGGFSVQTVVDEGIGLGVVGVRDVGRLVDRRYACSQYV